MEFDKKLMLGGEKMRKWAKENPSLGAALVTFALIVVLILTY